MARSHWGAPHLIGRDHPDATPAPDLGAVRTLLMRYLPPNTEQARTRVEMLSFLMDHEDALQRSCLEGHFTASALVIRAEGESGLLTLHRKLGRWLQLGGHCDGHGGQVAVNLEIDPRPIDLDIHRIPARKHEPEHWHLDTRFLVYAPPPAELVMSEESLDLRWIESDEILALDTDDSVRRLFRIAFDPDD